MGVLAPAVKGEIRVKRFIIPYRIYGKGGLSLVCLNGVQQSMAMWHSFVRRFASRHKIVLFDYPGQGKAEVTSGEVNVSIEEQVEILGEVIKVFGASKVILCSASWGGVVAMVFASRHPKLVRCLVLAGMGTKPNKKMAEIIKKGCNIEDKERDKMAQVIIKSFGKNLPKEMKERIARQFCAMSRESLSAFCEHGLYILSAKSLEEIIDFKNIKVQTILLNGEKDSIIDLEDVKFLASQIPDCKLKIVKNVGHFLHLEDESVLDIYSEILSKIEKKPA